ncbi:uncharacterized [Tachysurus ichikawai]
MLCGVISPHASGRHEERFQQMHEESNEQLEEEWGRQVEEERSGVGRWRRRGVESAADFVVRGHACAHGDMPVLVGTCLCSWGHACARGDMPVLVGTARGDMPVLVGTCLCSWCAIVYYHTIY